MNNLSSYCGLVDAKIRASDKDLPVKNIKAFEDQSSSYGISTGPPEGMRTGFHD